MASLHLAATILAGADLDIEATHHGLPNDLFLILRLSPFEFHWAPTVRAAFRKRNWNLLVDPWRDWSTGVAAVARARFAPRAFGFGFGFPARERRCLPFGGSQRFFQLLAQALVFLLQPLVFPVQLLDLLLRPLQFLLRDEFDSLGSFFRLTSAGSYTHSPYGSRNCGFCPAPF